MRLLLTCVALLIMSLTAGVAVARFAINGSLVSESDGLVMPHAALHSYAELCGSCATTSDGDYAAVEAPSTYADPSPAY